MPELKDKIRNCKKCPFDEGKDVRYCGGFGTDFRAVFIAESPSTSGGTGIKDADMNFRTTKADRLFYEVREKYGLQDCYVTDLVKCGISSGKPNEKKILNCLEYLNEELRLVKPKVLVTVGKSLSIAGMNKSVNFSVYLRELLKTDLPIFETWHYSYLWNRCQVIKENRHNPLEPEIRAEKLLNYMRQHEAIYRYLMSL